MHIRKARPSDLPALMAFFRELDRLQTEWRVFPTRSGLAGEVEERYLASLRDPDAVLLLALENGHPIGMALGHLHKPSSMSDQLAVELSSVFVRPSYRRRGVARVLTAEVARFARSRGVDRVTLKTFAQNEDALLAWQEMGFTPRMVQLTASVDVLEASGPGVPDRPAAEASEH